MSMLAVSTMTAIGQSPCPPELDRTGEDGVAAAVAVGFGAEHGEQVGGHQHRSGSQRQRGGSRGVFESGLLPGGGS